MHRTSLYNIREHYLNQQFQKCKKLNNVPFLCTKLFQKRGHYSRGDIIQVGTLFKEIWYLHKHTVHFLFSKSNRLISIKFHFLKFFPCPIFLFFISHTWTEEFRQIFEIKDPGNALGIWICGCRCILECFGSQNSGCIQYQKPQNQRVQKVMSQRSAGSCTRC